MPCTSPLFARPRSFQSLKKTHWQTLDDVTDDLDDLYFMFDGVVMRKHQGKRLQFFSRNPNMPNYINDLRVNAILAGKPYSGDEDIMTLRCGQCIDCRLAHASTWAARMVCEALYHSYNYFVTLTYDDDHLPWSQQHHIDLDTGELIRSEDPRPTLRYKDIQDFLKRLRQSLIRDRHLDIQVRYYCACEYGSLRGRPHYHIMFFGLPLDDLVQADKSQTGVIQYRSSWLESLWSVDFGTRSRPDRVPIGRVRVSEFNYATAGYVARYCTKKATGMTRQLYIDAGVEPESAHMSTKPAIGQQYYLDHADELVDTDHLYIANKHGDKPISLQIPRYYDKLLDLDDPFVHKEMLDHRQQVALDRSIAAFRLADNTPLEQLEIKSVKRRQNHLALIRGLETG